jgi:hypothetical protein
VERIARRRDAAVSRRRSSESIIANASKSLGSKPSGLNEIGHGNEFFGGSGFWRGCTEVACFQRDRTTQMAAGAQNLGSVLAAR